MNVTTLPPLRHAPSPSCISPTRKRQSLEQELEDTFRASLAQIRERALLQASEEIIRLKTDAELEQAAAQEQVFKLRDTERLKRHCDWNRKRPAPTPEGQDKPTPKGEALAISALAGVAASGAFLAFSLSRNPTWFEWSSALIVFVAASLSPTVVALFSRLALKIRPRPASCAYSVAIPACGLSFLTGVLLLWKGPSPEFKKTSSTMNVVAVQQTGETTSKPSSDLAYAPAKAGR